MSMHLYEKPNLKNLLSNESNNLLGTPLNTGSICIEVNQEYFYYNGAFDAQFPSSSLPSSLKKTYPLILFGFYDFISNYYYANKILQSGGWAFSNDFNQISTLLVRNLSTHSFEYQGYEHYYVGSKFNIGDVRFSVMEGIIPFVNYWYFTTTYNCKNLPYSTLLYQSILGKIRITEISFEIPVSFQEQLDNPLFISSSDMLGRTETLSINPKTFIRPNTYQKTICDIPVDFDLDIHTGIYMNVNYYCTNILFNIKFEILN